MINRLVASQHKLVNSLIDICLIVGLLMKFKYRVCFD